MSKIALVFMFTFTIPGCLDFGENEETMVPSKAQVTRCRAEMYINPSVKITPLGFKLESGIDSAIWFKFQTDSKDLAKIFDKKVVDTSKFSKGYKLIYKMKNLEWWDVTDKDLVGGQVSLPYGKYMNVGLEKTKKGSVIYIMWHET